MMQRGRNKRLRRNLGVLTGMAYVGTRKLFEDAGFTKAADTDSVSGGFPRVVMRLNLG
jgi:hypothetical protein